ncbi:MAG: hypothetical protein M1838_003684 [Thelocarpon superellum]|nr:MAG: hypothetical protein M1838_003684 [Thelocarpon superellum]
MAGLASSIYKQVIRHHRAERSANLHISSIFRQNTIFLATVFTGAFAFEMAFDTVTDSIWNTLNKGRQWQDIRDKYIEHDE